MQEAESGILAQNPGRLVHNAGFRRLMLAAVLPFLGVVAAFGIAPDTATEQITRTRVVDEVVLPRIAGSTHSNDTFWREESIQRGDTVANLLARLKVEDPEAFQALQKSRGIKTLYRLMPGRTVRAETSADGKLLALRYLYNGTLLSVDRNRAGYSVVEQPVELERRTLMKSGEIRSSLFAATDEVNVSDAIALQIADIFSTDIDFHRDLRKGDRFTVIYEVFDHLGAPVKTGRVLAAEFVNQGKTYQAVYFRSAEGEGGYYTLSGKNIRKAFLRSPLEFSRITSGFTNARYHPILREWRAHRGIDYAAPTGTRVKATGNGTVKFVGRMGGYGNLIVLRHQSKFSTWYGHLSRFAKGIHKGSRVSQGDVIGYVGMTGELSKSRQ